MVCKPGFGGEVANRTVRVDHVAIFFIHFPDGPASSDVIGCIATDFGCHRFPVITEELLHTHKVRRSTYVHGVGQGGHRRPWFVFGALEILRNNVVDVGGSNNMTNTQAQPLSKQQGGEVTEVTTWNDKDRWLFTLDSQLTRCLEVVEHLRNQA